MWRFQILFFFFPSWPVLSHCGEVVVGVIILFFFSTPTRYSLHHLKKNMIESKKELAVSKVDIDEAVAIFFRFVDKVKRKTTVIPRRPILLLFYHIFSIVNTHTLKQNTHIHNKKKKELLLRKGFWLFPLSLFLSPFWLSRPLLSFSRTTHPLLESRNIFCRPLWVYSVLFTPDLPLCLPCSFPLSPGSHIIIPIFDVPLSPLPGDILTSLPHFSLPVDFFSFLRDFFATQQMIPTSSFWMAI